ncbi:hypothetical protein QX995_002161 [Vibrio vulnificus]|nr:hypothetical protein [Vibrio vulnificus]
MFTEPRYKEFLNKVNSQDLARSNLFLVRFGDFRSILENDGIIDFTKEVLNSGFGVSNLNPSQGAPYAWKLVQRGAISSAYSALPHHAKKILGASDELGVFQDLFGSGLNDILDGNYRVNNDFALMVKSANLPQRTLDVRTNKTDRTPYGEVRDGGSGNITLTCYCSPDYIERRLMMMWMNAIHDESKQAYGFHDTYAREINIATLDRRGVPQSVVVCNGCFPIRIGDVQLDFDSNNNVATFEVEFFVAKQRHVNTLFHSLIKER